MPNEMELTQAVIDSIYADLVEDIADFNKTLIEYEIDLENLGMSEQEAMDKVAEALTEVNTKAPIEAMRRKMKDIQSRVHLNEDNEGTIDFGTTTIYVRKGLLVGMNEDKVVWKSTTVKDDALFGFSILDGMDIALIYQDGAVVVNGETGELVNGKYPDELIASIGGNNQ